MKRPIRKYLIVLISGVLVVAGVLAAVLLLSDPNNSEEASSGERNTSSEAPSSAGKEETETAQETTETSMEAAVKQSPEEPEASSVDEETTSQPETEAPSSTEPTTVEEPFVYKAPDEIIDTSTTCYNYEMMQADLQYLAKAYPDRLRLFSAGTTEDGRELSCAILGNPDAPRQIYVCAATHAREYMTAQLVMRQLAYYCTEYDSGTYNGRSFREIFEETCFYVEPMVNPDGVTISQLGAEGLQRADLRENLRKIFESDLNAGLSETADYAAYLVRWKANALGVDINRNYSPGWESVSERSAPSSTFYKGSAPGSERETQAQMSIVEGLENPLLAISYHSYGDLVYWQYGQSEPLWSQNEALAQHISDMTGQYLAGYSNEAGFSNWCVRVKNIPSVTVETGTVPAPLPLSQFAELWEEHRLIFPMLACSY